VGTFIYVVYVDAEHIRLGVDVWGVLGYQTDLLKVDYFAEHEIVVDMGALYPTSHPRLAQLPHAMLAQFQNQLLVDFDGQRVIAKKVNSYDSRLKDITIGYNAIGGSVCEPHFVGQILTVERLPIPKH
jgi:hypothetical protein